MALQFEIGDNIDKYTIVDILGEGGTAIVYKVVHHLLHTEFALKVSKHQYSQIYERLLREGRIQTKLKHPHIVSVIDILESKSYPALLMEYIEGVSLDNWLDKNKPTPELSERLFLQIVNATEYAHNQGVVHRDLKPSNILIMEFNGQPFAKICDFGLAKEVQDSHQNLTRTGDLMGTPAYMAPEQIRNAKGIDHRADIFSLGVIYYEMITHEMAFSGQDSLEILNAVAHRSIHLPQCISTI